MKFFSKKNTDLSISIIINIDIDTALLHYFYCIKDFYLIISK
jgi:hypothetical protein